VGRGAQRGKVPKGLVSPKNIQKILTGRSLKKILLLPRKYKARARNLPRGGRKRSAMGRDVNRCGK